MQRSLPDLDALVSRFSDVIASESFMFMRQRRVGLCRGCWGSTVEWSSFSTRILQEASHLAYYLLETHGADSWIERAGPGYVSALHIEAVRILGSRR